jgi:hypothetical protein
MALDMSKLQQQKAKLTQELTRGSGQSARFWRPSDGSNVIRVMPGWTEEEPYKGQFWREVAQHWGVSEDQRGPILCPEATPHLEGECPICKFVAELKENKNDVKAQELAKEIRAKKAFLINVVDTSDPTYNAQDVTEYKKARPDSDVPFEAGDPKIQVYACPKTIFDQILNCIMQNDQDITDLEKGNDITIDRTGKGMTTRYTVSPKLKSIASDVSGGMEFPQLERVGFNMSYEDMNKLLTDGVGGDFAALLPGEDTPAALGSGDDEASADADDLESQMADALS